MILSFYLGELMNGVAFAEIGNPVILIFVECMLCGNGGIMFMLNMKQLMQKESKCIMETFRAVLKSQPVRLKNSVLFSIDIVSQEKNRF